MAAPSNWYQDVKQFTEESKNIKCPDVPRPLKKEELEFILSMILDECLELTATYGLGKSYLAGILMNRLERPDVFKSVKGPVELAAEHADGFVDIIYYILNAAAKAGLPLDKVFEEVHSANMRKRDPETGKFLQNEHGKIIKPANYVPADITTMMRKLMIESPENI